MTFVCNAGPVIALAKIEHLHLLRELANPVWIPDTVFHEVLAKPGMDSSRILAASRDFIQVCELGQEPAAEFAGLSRQGFLSSISSLKVSPFQGVEDDLAFIDSKA